MSVITNSLAVDCMLGLLTLFLSLILYLNARYKYWKNRGIPYVKPQLFFGSFKDNLFGKLSITQIHEKIYKELKGERFGGFFELHVPNLMIMDTDLIHRILVKDFAYFHDRGMFPVDVEYDPLTNTVANLEGQQWRNLRYKMSPMFSSGKFKAMFDNIYNSGEEFMKELDKYAKNGNAVEARDILSTFTIDVIASCGFGLQFKLNGPEGQAFNDMVKNAFPQSRFIVVGLIMKMLYTNFSKLLGLRTFPKNVTEYFLNLSKNTVQYRKQNDIKGNDFLQLLLNLKESEENSKTHHEEDEKVEEDTLINQLKQSSVYNVHLKDAKVMTEECLAASSFLFLAAGTEISSAIRMVIYYIATIPSVQYKIQQELDEVYAKHGTYNYQAIKDLVYLESVIQESFRIFSSAGFIVRICTLPYQIPDSNVVLEKGTRITIPVWSLHRDPQYYQNPEVFDPDRFIGNNFKPSPTFLPFGDGPRICIAMRFAILEMKVCLARMMSQYTVQLSNKTNEPLKMDTRSLLSQPEGGIWITIKNRK